MQKVGGYAKDLNTTLVIVKREVTDVTGYSPSIFKYNSCYC